MQAQFVEALNSNEYEVDGYRHYTLNEAEREEGVSREFLGRVNLVADSSEGSKLVALPY